MTKYLKISSKGTMEEEALSLIGASTKRGDSSTIGMFGSGLKYSIATMIRQNIEFKVFSGYNLFEITTKPVMFNNMMFNKILINGKETSLTDSMGTEDWDGAWPFIREIYSNALDEGEARISIEDEIIPDEDRTCYFITITDKIKEIVDNFSQYFITKSKHLYADKHENYIHSTVGFCKIYRKGIAVHEVKHKKALFSYDLSNIEINESRVLKYTWKANEIVAKMIEECTDKIILTTFFNGIANANFGLMEHECYLASYSDSSTPSEEWIEYVKKGKFYPVEIEFMLNPEDKIGRLALPMKFLVRFVKFVPNADILGMTVNANQDSDAMYVITEPSEDMTIKIKEAIALLHSTSYRTRLKYPIKVCNFKGSNILGRFHNNTILLSSKLDMQPTEVVATIIIEEQEHGTSGFGDLTRTFQNHLFSLLMSAYKETAHIKEMQIEIEALKKERSKPWYKKVFR